MLDGAFYLVCDACLSHREVKTCTHGRSPLNRPDSFACVECGAVGPNMNCLGMREGKMHDQTNGMTAPTKAANDVLKVRECDQKTCSNAAVAVVVLLLRPAGYRGRPMRMRCGLVVCKACQSPLPDKFIDNESWQRLLAHFDAAGKKRPHRTLTEVEYVPIGEDASLEGYE